MGKSKTEELKHKLVFSPKKEWRIAHTKDTFPSHLQEIAATVSPFKVTQYCLTPYISVPFRISLSFCNYIYFAFWPYQLQSFKGVNMCKVAESSIEQYSLSKEV